MQRVRTSYFEVDRPRVEVIPMIDIMMFLLVFFVVISLKMIAGAGVAMELPGSATTQEIKSSSLTIGVTKAGEMVIDGMPVSEATVGSKLLALKPPVQVLLAGDKDTSLQSLLKVMDVVRGTGITTVGIATKAEKR